MDLEIGRLRAVIPRAVIPSDNESMTKLKTVKSYKFIQLYDSYSIIYVDLQDAVIVWL